MCNTGSNEGWGGGGGYVVGVVVAVEAAEVAWWCMWLGM